MSLLRVEKCVVSHDILRKSAKVERVVVDSETVRRKSLSLTVERPVFLTKKDSVS